jgi:hypothetical protein
MASTLFSAGNTPGADSLNPYSIAPWVISTGATDNLGNLANFHRAVILAAPLPAHFCQENK